MQGQARLIFLICLVVCLLGAPVLKASAQEPAAEPQSRLSQDELRRLVRLLENEQERLEFTRHLKALIRLQEEQAAAPAEPTPEITPIVERLFRKFDHFSEQLIETGRNAAELTSRLPEYLSRLVRVVSDPAGRADLGQLLADTLGGLLFAMAVAVLIRRFRPKIPETRPGLFRLLVLALKRLIYGAAPYFALLIAVFGLYQTFPVFREVQAIIVLFLFIVFCYQISVHFLLGLLSPEAASARLVPLNDEDANYVWVWGLRFARLTAFYFFVNQGLLAMGLSGESHSLIRGVLLVVFPMLLTILILQIAREIKNRRASAEPKPAIEERAARKEALLKELSRLAAGYWAVPAVIYTWAVFIFLISRYRAGFQYLISGTLGTIAVLLGLLLLLALNDKGFRKLFAVSELIKARFPMLEEKTDRYLKVFRTITRAIIVIIGLFVLAQVWGVPVAAMVGSKAGALVIARILAIAFTVGVVVVVMGGSQMVTDWLLEEKEGKQVSQHRKTLAPLINTTIKVAAGFVGGVVILGQLGVNVAPILAGAGILGLGVGLGAQSLVKDFINGIFILFQDMIAVGDWAVLGDKSGLVEAISLRAVRLRDLSGNVHIIPNSAIDSVTNMTKGFSRAVLDIGVAYREDVDQVMDILREIGEEMLNDPQYGPDILEPLEVLGLQKFDDSAVIVRARVTTKPMKQWAIGREFNRRIKKVFDARGIEIPFPHRTVYMGQPKQGQAPPLEVHIERS